MKTFLFCSLLVVVAMPVQAAKFVYVSVGGEDRIAVYRQEGGKLTHVGDQSADGSPGSLTIDPTRSYLYGSLRKTKRAGTYRINQQTGLLTELATISLEGRPAYLSTDSTGRFLLGAYYSDGKASVHRIGSDGLIREETGWYYETEKTAHAIVLDGSERFAFVPHTRPNKVYQFRFDAEGGTLQANDVPALSTQPDIGPRHLSFHPNQKFAYFSNEQGSGVTACAFDKETGRLSILQTISSLPEGFSENNSCAHIGMTGNGKFVYVANRGHDSIAGYAVDAASGRLTALGQFATESIPRSFDIDAEDAFLIAAGERSGKVASFRIEVDGRLTRLETIDVGKGPGWVETLTLD